MWHNRSAEDVISSLNGSLQGLSAQEAARRFEQYGPNVLEEKKGRSPFTMLLNQFRDFLILVLLGAALLSGVVGDWKDSIAIFVIVCANAVIGFIQEYRAEQAMAALKSIAAPTATVLRDGVQTTVASSELVPGDIVLLEAGRLVPADLRLIESAQMRVDESMLTGESLPVDKTAGDVIREQASIGDRKNMAFKGTIVTYGRGSGVVVATGMQTEIGKIAGLLQENEAGMTPLQKRLKALGKQVAVVVLIVCAIVFGVGIMKGESIVPMFLTAVSLAVAAIPEALPAVLTITLALGAKRLARVQALMRRLAAVETLGSVTYICTDKTGTLTMNRMKVEMLWHDGSVLELPGSVPDVSGAATDVRVQFWLALALSNDADIGADGVLLGDPTETALLSAAEGAGVSKQQVQRQYPRVAEVPFDSDRKCMTTIHRLQDGTYLAFTKGAVDMLIERSKSIAGGRGIAAAELMEQADRMARDGMRVLAFAVRRLDELPEKLLPETVETDLVLLGLVGLIDPPRPEAAEAVQTCIAAGIRPVMITGDHPLTAMAIARRIGILGEAEDRASGHVLTGTDLAEMTDPVFSRRVPDIKVYARVAPEQKLRIVKALQAAGQYVAMTGDGVNDAPALKRADIGIAMGITGTDVAKESAQMVLLDDNFATIVKTVREGRKIYDNIRKFIQFNITTNVSQVSLIFLAPFLGLPVPIQPIHILWINLITDGFPALALSAERAEARIMERPPRRPDESIFAGSMPYYIVLVGLFMAGIVLLVQEWGIRSGMHNWQTMVFVILALAQLANVFAVRTETESVFTRGVFSNRPLVYAVVGTFILQLATVYVPFLNPVFDTSPLTLPELAFSIAAASMVFFLLEFIKLMRRMYP